jgi:Transglycosylase SLT domain
MSLRSILDIDLSKHEALLKIMERYQAALKKGPPAWAEITTRMTETEKLLKRQLTVTQQLAAATKQIPDNLGTSVTKWAAIDRLTLRVASSVGSMASSLVRIGAMTSLIGGLAGAGTLFGLDRLALSVAGQRRSSLGLGLSIGEQNAFGANFARLVDPGSFLSGVAGARFDVTQRVGLLGAGLTGGQLQGDTAEVGIALLQNLKRIADNTNPALFGQVIQARRLGGFVSPEDLERLRNTSPAEFAKLISRYGSDRGAFAVPQDVSEKWQEFTTQMARAGQGIENAFVRGLAPLTPGLTKLSAAVENVIRAFLSSPALERWIGQVDKALEKFAGYVGTPDFEQQVRTFVEGLGKIASAVAGAVSWVAGSDPQVASQRAVATRNASQLRTDRASGRASAWSQFTDILNGQSPAAIDNVMGLVRRAENSGDTAVSPKGAIGRYQVMPDLARRLGFDPNQLTDPAYNERVARTFVEQLVRKYHGNVADVLAAYNAGEPRVDAYLAHPGDQRYALPRETQNYGRRVGYPMAPDVNVKVENPAGANVIVSTNGLKN